MLSTCRVTWVHKACRVLVKGETLTPDRTQSRAYKNHITRLSAWAPRILTVESLHSVLVGLGFGIAFHHSDPGMSQQHPPSEAVLSPTLLSMVNTKLGVKAVAKMPRGESVQDHKYQGDSSFDQTSIQRSLSSEMRPIPVSIIGRGTACV